MKPGKRYSHCASLELVRMIGIDESVTDGLLELKSMHTVKNNRNQGHATRLLKEVCEEADKANMILVLTPEQFDNGPIGTQQLKNWYAKHGFNVIQERPILMCRDPLMSLAQVGKVIAKIAEPKPAERYDIETDQFHKVSGD